jgi:hypothetical protein
MILKLSAHNIKLNGWLQKRHESHILWNWDISKNVYLAKCFYALSVKTSLVILYLFDKK